MRDNYVGDIGDYAKYALLRSISLHRTSDPLGVMWYRTVHPEANTHGSRRAHLAQLDWDALDPAALVELRRLHHARGEHLAISDIETSNLLRPSTVFHGVPVPLRTRESASSYLVKREQWFGEGTSLLRGCRTLFLDPDTGLAPPGAVRTSSNLEKYVLPEEVVLALISNDVVILYQHGARIQWSTQQQSVLSRLGEAGAKWDSCFVAHFRAGGSRAFFVFANGQRAKDDCSVALEQLHNRAAAWSRRDLLTIREVEGV